MKRRLFNIITLFSLLLCVLIIGLFAWSFCLGWATYGPVPNPAVTAVLEVPLWMWVFIMATLITPGIWVIAYMKGRWAIRSFAILLVVACTVPWVRSFYRSTYITHQMAGHYYTRVMSQKSAIHYYYELNDTGSTNRDEEWDYRDIKGSQRDDYTRFENSDALVFHILGFEYGHFIAHHTFANDEIICFAIPYWFIESTAILFGLFVWRKTCPKPNTATAFPVIMDKMKT